MTLPGSSRAPVPDLDIVGPVDAAEPVEATLVLRRRAPLPPGIRLTRDELAERYGADPADADAVQRALGELGIDVLDADLASRRIRVAGPAGVLSDAFGTTLRRARTAGVEHRYREGELSLPGALSGTVVAVLGLDTRPQARSRLRIAASADVSASYTPPQLAQVYGMPDGDGTGQTVAIIELGGGFAQSDLETYFGGLGIPTPQVSAVGVDGASNSPGAGNTDADGEVLLDIEVVGGIAPKAAVVVYFAPNTDAGFLDAISTAAHASPAPTAMSISWGQSEDAWTEQSRTAMDDAMADAAALGVTVTAASGDDGSSDQQSGVHCDYPASSPYALGCGGTTLQADPATGTVTSETVWNGGSAGGATGGGVSDLYPVPDWQANAGVPSRSGDGGGTGRGVPDVAADADPATGYQVYVDGQAQVYGGTSAVAPLWAGLIARLAQLLDGPLGPLQPKLYAGAAPGQPAPGLRDITSGSNGAYQAGPGWDACTGLGVPNGAALLQVLQG